MIPSGPRSQDTWSRPRRPQRNRERDHVRKRVVRTGCRPSSLGRQPDSDVTYPDSVSARSRQSIALTCEVGGDLVMTTVSRPVVTTDTTVASL